jgi:hypothetical protein
MMRIAPTIASLALLLGSHGSGRADEDFEKVGVYLEQNIQDEDAEVKFEAVGPSSGLAALKVIASDGRTVIDFRTPNSKLGIQHLTLESPEPKNNGSIQADFPEGAYQFTGTTTKGATLQGEARLSHKLPDPVSLLHPRADEKNVPVTGLQVRWNPVRSLAAYLVVVEDEKTGREINANLPPAATGFAIPDGFLAFGTAYKLAVATVANDGNKSFVEISFTTAARKRTDRPE